MVYSRDEVVAIVTDYYKFILRINHEPEDLKVPPEGGWTTIPADALRTQGGRSDDVIDLLRHLPYLASDNLESHVIPETSCTDYAHLSQDYREALDRGRFDGVVEPSLDEGEALGRDVVCIADGRRHAWSLLLDLTNGTIIWHSNDGSWGDEDYDLGDILPGNSPRVVESPAGWRNQPTYDLKYFFSEFCKNRLNEMKWLPHIDGEIRSVHPRDDDDDEAMLQRQMLRDAGWPGDGDAGGNWDQETWLSDERHEEL